MEKSKNVSICIRNNIYDLIEKYSKKLNINRSELINYAIRNLLKSLKNREKEGEKIEII